MLGRPILAESEHKRNKRKEKGQVLGHNTQPQIITGEVTDTAWKPRIVNNWISTICSILWEA